MQTAIIICITLATLENLIYFFCKYELLVEDINSEYTSTNITYGQTLTLFIYVIEVTIVIISLITIYTAVVVLLVRNHKKLC
jgi:hypothetical protein